MPNDYEFSGPGDIDRVTGSNTTDSSRAANAAAAETEGSIEPTLRHGYSETVDLDEVHAYG